MTVIKSLWAPVQGDPVFMRRVNGWFTIFWIAMIPVSLVAHWLSSVTYVAAEEVIRKFDLPTGSKKQQSFL